MRSPSPNRGGGTAAGGGWGAGAGRTRPARCAIHTSLAGDPRNRRLLTGPGLHASLPAPSAGGPPQRSSPAPEPQCLTPPKPSPPLPTPPRPESAASRCRAAPCGRPPRWPAPWRRSAISTVSISGHRAVISRAEALARSLGRPACVLTFEPHPRAYFRPGEPHFSLTPSPSSWRCWSISGSTAPSWSRSTRPWRRPRR